MISFRYRRMRRPGPLEPVLMPVIPVTLKGPVESVEVMALIDPGADTTFLPSGITDIPGLDLSGAVEERGMGFGGTVTVKSTSVACAVGRGRERHSLRLAVKVLPDTPLDFVMPGRQGFFDSSDITFRQRELRMILKKVQG